MKNTFDKIFLLVKNPAILETFSIDEWNSLISQARFHDMVPFVYQMVADHGLIDWVPGPIKELMEGYQVRLVYQQTLFLWESRKLKELVLKMDYPVVLLKGMAYLEDKLGTYPSRGFADIDLLVPEDQFNNFEQLLLNNGWEYKKLNTYDDHYYREWSHASPPMRHKDSGIELDLHHHISSPISDIKINTDCLLSEIKLIDKSNLYRLSDPDLILHCANHFIYFDDLQGKLKDLVLIYFLIKQFNHQDIWNQLYQRSHELGLIPTLYYMTRLLDDFFDLQPPTEIKKNISLSTKGLGKYPVLYSLKHCIAPKNPESLGIKVMNFLLLARYQWTRYPVNILLLHLIRKHLIAKIKNRLTKV